MRHRGAAPLEIETKLSIPDEQTFVAIAALRRIGSFTLNGRRKQRLITRYWDTPDFTLSRGRSVLRTRARGGVSEATVKRANTQRGALHQRVEITVPLRQPPHRRWLKLPAKIASGLGAQSAQGPFVPIVVSDIERTSFRVVWKGKRIAELALDRVRIRAPGERRTRLRYLELEVESCSSDARQIKAITADLRRRFHLKTSPDSKFSAGMKAVYGSARSMRIQRGEPSADSRRKAASA